MEPGVGPSNPYGSLPTPDILRFYDDSAFNEGKEVYSKFLSPK